MTVNPYDSVSDERLAVSAASGDDSAMAFLIIRTVPTVKMLASKFRVSGIDTEDLAQEGMIGFLGAVKTFDESNGALFRTYAASCISNRMMSAVRKASKSFSSSGKSTVSADSMEEYLRDDVVVDPESIVVGKDEADRLLDILNKNLSGFEQSVLHLYLSGDNYGKIAERLSVSSKAVDNALQRIRRKLKAFSNMPR